MDEAIADDGTAVDVQPNAMTYVLITPARNEEAFIENTIRSVVCQTVLPERWVIVSDGSTDRTDEIVQGYLEEHPWMELLRLPVHHERHFGNKVRAFRAGYERVQDIPFEVTGNLDADVSFDKDFMEYLLSQFSRNPRLGVAGTDYREGGFHSYRDSFISSSHVNGQCQLFRRACYEEIGGYRPIKGGGIDWVAVTTARMKGWETRSFPDKTFYHHRKMGSESSNGVGIQFEYGKKDYLLGGHPIWEIVRGCYYMMKKPYVISGGFLLSGYCWAWLSRMERPVEKDLIFFHRNEQMKKLKLILKSILGGTNIRDGRIY